MSEAADSDDLVGQMRAWATHQHDRYAHGEDRPLGSYLGLELTYLGAVLLGAGMVKVSGRRLPERVAGRDLALLAVATHKASRLITKETVTSSLRAPFTSFEGAGGPAELHEEVRGSGVRHAVGELVTCPFCMAQWVATVGMFGLVVAPRATRFVASTFAAVAGSDFLQFGYAAAQPD